MDSYTVHPITAQDAKPWILKKHYAHRMPAVQKAYGLFNGRIMEGVVAYGPTCRSLNNGYGAFGEPLADNSYELLRLCIDSDNPNAASTLVGRSLKLLPSPAFVVSYADGNAGHIGYVYQATNWLYTGITAKEKTYTDSRTGAIIHPRSVVSLFGSRAAETLPDYIEIDEETAGKHRYITFTGNRRQKKRMLDNLKYPIFDYPKGDTHQHESEAEFATQMLLFGGAE